jgi:SSS family solute:Na+ symporter
MIWFLVFLVGTAWNLIAPWPLSVWSSFWNVVGIGIPVFIAVVTGIWFTWGGIKDVRDLFRRLRQEKINHLDDGTVVNHQNLDEFNASPSAEKVPILIAKPHVSEIK